MSELFFSQLAGSQNALQSRIAGFMFQPGNYIHHSWLEDWMSSKLFSNLRRADKARRCVDRIIMRRFDLDHGFEFVFGNANHRIALLEPEVLRKLVEMTGVAILGRRLAKLVRKDEVLKYRERLGEEAYAFAINKAPFLTGSDWEEKGFMSDDPEVLGLECLADAMTGCSPAILSRLRLIFPKGDFPDVDESFDPEETARCNRLLRKVLLQEVSPQCAHLFT